MQKKPQMEVGHTKQVLVKYYIIIIGIPESQAINVLVGVVYMFPVKGNGVIIHVMPYHLRFVKFLSTETVEYILSKIPERNFSVESFSMLMGMTMNYKIQENVKRLQSSLLIQESKSNIVQSNIDQLNTSMFQKLNSIQSNIKSIELFQEHLHLLSNSSNIKFIDHDKKHETSNDSMEYLQEEINREKEERIIIQITFLVLIVLLVISLVSIVYWLACHKRSKSRSVSNNIYVNNQLQEETFYEMVM